MANSSPLTPDVDPTATPEPRPDAPEPNLEKLGEAVRDTATVRSLALTGLFLIALFYALQAGREVFLPLTLAVLFNFLFSPVIRAMSRLRIPTPISAAIVVLGLIGLIILGVQQLTAPAEAWLARAPRTMAVLNEKMRIIRKPMDRMTKTAEQVAQVATATPEPPPTTKAPTVVVQQGPSFSSRFVGSTQSLLASALEILILLYFLLAAGDMFLQKLIKVLPHFRDKKRAVTIMREVEASTSIYLGTIALLNITEGAVVAAVLWLLHMPNAPLWGVLVALLEFVPYVGAATMVAVLTLAGLTTFPTIGQGLLIPGGFLVVNLLWSNVVSPIVLGRRLTLNPLAIFVSVMVFWQLWGIAGGFVAVPLVATVKIFCDHIESLAPLGEFLGK